MQSSNRKILLGAIFIILGGLIFLDNFGIFWFDFRHLIFSWYSVFIIIGAIILINHKNSLIGYIFLAAGLYGILKRTVPFFFDLSLSDLWPLIFLVIGLYLILKRNGNKKKYFSKYPFIEPDEQISTNGLDIVDINCVFNSCKRIVTTKNFKGGVITSIFGGVKLDLTNAELAPGENILEVTTLFGGCNIRVPANWKIQVNVSSVFGGFDDKRYTQLIADQTSQGVLIIKGAAIFGGGELIY